MLGHLGTSLSYYWRRHVPCREARREDGARYEELSCAVRLGVGVSVKTGDGKLIATMIEQWLSDGTIETGIEL